MRQVVLDTETTGLSAEDGHRVIEIGCVELVDRRLTRGRFHVYLNPDRPIDEGASAVHGITGEFLADKPRFAEVADDFLSFVGGAELVIHNAPFDVGFLNRELDRLGEPFAPLEAYCTVADSLQLARRKHPGQRNSLDALCKRYGVDNSHRDLHGALLDAEILAEVYLAMTGGQVALLGEEEASTTGQVPVQTGGEMAGSVATRPVLRIVWASPEEVAAHQAFLVVLNEASGGKCCWVGVSQSGS